MIAREAAKDAKENRAEELATIVVDCAYHLHRSLGPGLLESVYEAVLCGALTKHGLSVARQHLVSFEYDGMRFNEGLRLDLFVEDTLVVELKSVETLAPVHSKQVLTYLRLIDVSLGLLINFGAPTFKAGCKRIVNAHRLRDLASLRENEPGRAAGR